MTKINPGQPDTIGNGGIDESQLPSRLEDGDLGDMPSNWSASQPMPRSPSDHAKRKPSMRTLGD